MKKRIIPLAIIISLFLVACGSEQATVSTPTPTPTPAPTTAHGNDEIVLEKYDESIYRAITDSYLEYLEPADDKYDYRWKYDYFNQYYTTYVCDASGYEKIFGFSKPTREELIETLYKNDTIEPQTRELIEDFINKWLDLWPETDFSILKKHLETLTIKRISGNELYQLTNVPGIDACYVKNENLIYMNEDANYYDKESKDYLIFLHELLHVCRDFHLTEYSIETYASFYNDGSFGLYADEAMATIFAAKISGGVEVYPSYPVISNYYDFITEAIDYTGEEYMNHSLNYLIDKMDTCMGDDNYAYHIIGLIDMQGQIHYDSYNAITNYDNFIELYQYIMKIYCKSYYPGIKDKETIMNGFDDFWAKLSRGYSVYKPYKNFNEDYMKKIYMDFVEENY